MIANHAKGKHMGFKFNSLGKLGYHEEFATQIEYSIRSSASHYQAGLPIHNMEGLSCASAFAEQ
jgi:hypothetical protein